MEPVQLAAVLAGVVLVASMVSIELGVTVALVELTLGVLAGNTLDLHSQEWLGPATLYGTLAKPRLAALVRLARSNLRPGLA